MSSGTLQPTGTHHLRDINPDRGSTCHADTIRHDTVAIFQVVLSKTRIAVNTAIENLGNSETIMRLFYKSGFRDGIVKFVSTTYAKTIARANAAEGNIKIEQSEIEELVQQTLLRAVNDNGACLASTPSDNTHQKEDT